MFIFCFILYDNYYIVLYFYVIENMNVWSFDKSVVLEYKGVFICISWNKKLYCVFNIFYCSCVLEFVYFFSVLMKLCFFLFVFFFCGVNINEVVVNNFFLRFFYVIIFLVVCFGLVVVVFFCGIVCEILWIVKYRYKRKGD